MITKQQVDTLVKMFYHGDMADRALMYVIYSQIEEREDRISIYKGLLSVYNQDYNNLHFDNWEDAMKYNIKLMNIE